MNCNEFLTQLYAEMRGKDKTYKNLRDAIVKVSEKNYSPSEFSIEKREEEKGRQYTRPPVAFSGMGAMSEAMASLRRFLDCNY